MPFKTVQAAAEAARIAAEQAQTAAEAAQMTAEQERDTAKAAQMTAEQAQAAAEAAQMAAEQAQVAAGAAQMMAEQERDDAKAAQMMAEQAQAAAEAARMAAEQARTTAETARMTADQAVDDMRSAAVTNAIEKVTAFGGQPHRCAMDTGCGSDSGVDYSSVSITHDIGYRDYGERLIHAIHGVTMTGNCTLHSESYRRRWKRGTSTFLPLRMFGQPTVMTSPATQRRTARSRITAWDRNGKESRE